MFDDKKILYNTLWNILTRGNHDEVVIELANNLSSLCYKNGYYVNISFVEAVILIEIDFNKIVKKALELTKFYTHQIHKFWSIKLY